MGFGCPCSTVHFHGGHVEAVSDGFPENIDEFTRPIVFAPMGLVGCEPPEGIDEMVKGCETGAPYFRDYCYAMKDVGFVRGYKKPEERASTNWYHDHLFDFTGPNVYRGLAGMFLVFDEWDAGDETGALFPATNLRFPSGDYDVPLILQDKRFVIENGVAALVYTMEHDGFLGDKFLVNGKIQPYFVVERRKYRFRILDASNARFYLLALTKGGRQQSFTEIGGHGSLFNYPLQNSRTILVTPAERHDIVIDFSRFATGDTLYLEDLLGQDDGRGPDGTFARPRQSGSTKLLKFIVGNNPAVPDPSRSSFDLRGTPREIKAISEAEKRGARRRTFIFDRTQGAWSVNNMLADLEHPIASPRLDQGEIWTLKNGGGGWWHPIHVHLEFMRVLKRNRRLPPLDERDGFAKEDTVILGPGDELEVFIKFRDFRGPFVFHCHNIEHEDMRMMARFDVIEP
jgi:FtsP/CotA-like multicopper oxidase with cupredoxin domain